MPTLHTVNKSPFERNSLATCLERAAGGDGVLLCEDAVIGARKGSAFAKALAEKAATCAIYALAPDLAARGIKGEDVVEAVKTVDYSGFVDLAADADR
ncbi:MAG: sulfurtransferase complex subunit TusB, partial [Hyphomicrobiales bacterium]|nr:sulfurtransferase complex subunit TusB [Hyphomicrobiales bacterium]